jgi:hypothetical protein
MHQLVRRFTGDDLLPNYSADEIREVIRTSTSALFMVNDIVAKRLGWEGEWKKNTDLFAQSGVSTTDMPAVSNPHLTQLFV